MDTSYEQEIERLLLYKQNKHKVMYAVETSAILPRTVQEFAEKYADNALGKRTDFLWKWLDYSTRFVINAQIC